MRCFRSVVTSACTVYTVVFDRMLEWTPNVICKCALTLLFIQLCTKIQILPHSCRWQWTFLIHLQWRPHYFSYKTENRSKRREERGSWGHMRLSNNLANSIHCLCVWNVCVSRQQFGWHGQGLGSSDSLYTPQHLSSWYINTNYTHDTWAHKHIKACRHSLEGFVRRRDATLSPWGLASCLHIT